MYATGYPRSSAARPQLFRRRGTRISSSVRLRAQTPMLPQTTSMCASSCRGCSSITARRNPAATKGDVMDPDAVVHMTIDLIKNTPMDGKVGIEMGSVSHAFYGKLAASQPEGMIVDGSSVTRNCRVVDGPVGDRYASSGWLPRRIRHWRAMARGDQAGYACMEARCVFAYEASKLNLEHGTCGRSHSFIPAVGPYTALRRAARTSSRPAMLSSLTSATPLRLLERHCPHVRRRRHGSPTRCWRSTTRSIRPTAWAWKCSSPARR